MIDSKICFKCEILKPLSEFYKHAKMADGHLNKCKECTKNDVKLNMERNYDYYREYDRQRANLTHRVDARVLYQKTDNGKKSGNKAKKSWAESNTIKRSASYLVNNSVKSGKLIKKYECECCGVSGVKIHGHHDDYAYPLSVRWLCSPCHRKWHKENGEGMNAS